VVPKEFSEAVFHSEHVVLGKKLQPFCLYHLLALETIESPFLDDEAEKPITLRDLERAVLICSIPLPTTQKEDIEYSYKISNIFDIKGLSDAEKKELKSWLDENKKMVASDEYNKFLKFVADFSPSPDVIIEESGGQTIGAHWILSCASNVIKFSGWSKEYVFSMAAGLVYHFSVYFAASEGANVKFSSEKELGVMEWLESQGIKYSP
jgi:hypothetical protein